MNADAQEILIVVLALCSPFLLSFLIVAILSPRYQALAERNGWTVQPHPEDHRDHLFKGENNGIQWEMELYIYEHYRKLPAKHIPFTHVMVWTSERVMLSKGSLLIYPRKDTLKHFVHPRLSLEKDMDLVGVNETQNLERDLLVLPEKPVGSLEFQKQFILRTDLDDLPGKLMNRLQYEFLSWPKIQFVGPVIVINSSGITIWWIPIGLRHEWLEKTVHVGTTLAGLFK